jgi:hypothetical protein
MPAMKLKQKRGFIIGAAVAGALATAGGALAAIPDSTSGVITSCYDTTGIVRVIDRAQSSCPGGSTQLQWNQQGRTGPTGPRGPQGADGASPDVKTFWVHLGKAGEDKGRSGPRTYGGSMGSGSGSYYIIVDDSPATDLTKCAITATPAGNGFPLNVDVAYTGSYYAVINLKQVTPDRWPLSYRSVDNEVYIVAACGTTK